MTEPVKCSRCGVTIPADKLAVPDRCRDANCPTTPASELERRHAVQHEDFGRMPSGVKP